jgi:hypothetical protein
MIRPIQDGVPFIESLEQSVSEGNLSHIKANEERIIVTCPCFLVQFH